MRTLLTKLRWLLQRRRKEAELRAELDFHLDQEAADARDRGLSQEDARISARRHIGNRTLVEEDTRAAWGWTWFERIGQDVRYAARLLRRRPVLSATAILTLMLGIGGTTAVFSLLDALLMRTLPVERPQELVRLVERRPDGTTADAFTLVTHDTLQRASKALSGVIASSDLLGRPTEIEAGGERRSAFVQLVSDNYFEVLGVHPFRGRVFHQPQPGRPGEPVAIISYAYWRRQYNGDESVLGTHFRRGACDFTVAGIAPLGFGGMEVDVPVDIWLSIEQVVPPNSVDRIRGRWMRVTGRLRPGTTAAQAETEATAILGRPVHFRPGGTGYSRLRLRFYQPLLLVAVVVALVLLIACANLANLMLAATVSREREIAVRTAIGASRKRIIRQLITENLLLSMLGAALGLAVAYWVSGALLAFLPPEQAIALPNLRFRVDARVLSFVASLSVVTCVLFGVAPALRVTSGTTATSMKAGGAGHHRRGLLRGALLVGQIVMCTALLVVASVFVRSLQNLRGQETGYREDRVLVADVGFPRSYPEIRRDQLIEELRTRAAGLSGVEAAAFSHLGQLSGTALEFRIGFPGRGDEDAERMTIIEQRISPGFLGVMGTPLVAGREFAPSDDNRAPLVAIVNESFARRFLPGENPIGARFFRDGGSRSGELMEVVGVAKDSKWINLRDDAPPMYYRPYRQMGGTPVVRLALRTFGDPALLTRELRRVALSVDSQIMLTNVVPFREIVDRTLVTERLVAQVSAVFGALALLIAAVGLYGVLAYSVARRRREIGLRIAVGAEPRAIETMFLRESLTLAFLGIAIGIPSAIGATRFASSMLFGLSPQDPASIGIASSALILTTAAAAFLPARSAARTDPLLPLREE